MWPNLSRCLDTLLVFLLQAELTAAKTERKRLWSNCERLQQQVQLQKQQFEHDQASLVDVL